MGSSKARAVCMQARHPLRQQYARIGFPLCILHGRDSIGELSCQSHSTDAECVRFIESCLPCLFPTCRECKEFVLELERMGAPPLLVQLSIFDRWALQPWQAVAAHTLAPAGR
jgi:hypothetical protein